MSRIVLVMITRLKQPLPLDATVWQIDLNTCAAVDLNILSDVEKMRYHRFATETLKRHFLVAHVGMRHILGQVLDVAPDALVFDKASKGKPFLQGHDVQFNLSHAGRYALVAVASVPVGVDIETLSHPCDALGLATRYFTQREASIIAHAAADEQHALFIRFWTRKEAYLKGLGCGLVDGLDSCEISEAVIVDNALLSADPNHLAWKVLALSVGAGYDAAFAINIK